MFSLTNPVYPINIFALLGEHIASALDETDPKLSSSLQEHIQRQSVQNPWFTPANQVKALAEWVRLLTAENLTEWAALYPEFTIPGKSRRVGIIMAGNIPLVGFHDMLSVLITGHTAIVRLSSKDTELYRFMHAIMASIDPDLANRIEFTEEKLPSVDAIIATGSNNSSRYFEYYFGKYPNIIRKNRNSVAILTGEETEHELVALGEDIFSWFGLGCRNVSKLYLPAGYSPASLFDKWGEYKSLADHSVYANNYDYNKAIMLVNREEFLDGGFILMRENEAFQSPISVLNYSYYSDILSVSNGIILNQEAVQCVVSSNNIFFGKSQMPALYDYADNIDTISFLLKLKMGLII